MKTIIKVAVVLLCVAAAIAYYIYNRISYQPEWYLQEKEAGEYQLTGNFNVLQSKIKQALESGKSVEIPASHMVALIAGQLEKKTGFEIQEAIKAERTTIDPNGIEVEMIVDVRRIPPENLSKDDQKLLKKFLELVPEKTRNNLYVKCNMQVLKQAGSVSLDPLSSIFIGKMKLPVSALQKQTGSKGKFSLESLSLSDIELGKNAIILKP